MSEPIRSLSQEELERINRKQAEATEPQAQDRREESHDFGLGSRGPSTAEKSSQPVPVSENLGRESEQLIVDVGKSESPIINEQAEEIARRRKRLEDFISGDVSVLGDPASVTDFANDAGSKPDKKLAT